MADLPKALAGLISALLATQDGKPVDRDSLERMRNALEQLDDEPDAATELQERIERARQDGEIEIDSAPIGLLHALVQSNKGGCDDE